MNARRRPAELVALCNSARLTVQMERLTHIRMPIFAHFELVMLLDCARRLAHPAGANHPLPIDRNGAGA